LPWLALGVAASRYVFRSRELYDLDSVNFALALQRFDPEVHQPHPPGYYLYIQAGRAAQLLFPHPNDALVALSILASVGAVALIWALARAWYGPRAALAAGLVFLFSPLAWFHGTVALTYAVEALFSALVGYLCWRGAVPASAVALGVAAGFRQSSLFMLGPLWLWTAWRAGRRKTVLGCAALAASLLAWWIPMTRATGGAGRYWEALDTLWSSVAARQNDTAALPAMVVARFCLILAMLGFTLGAGLLLARREGPQLSREGRIFFWIWVTPGLVFFSGVYLLLVNSGYLLVLTPPLFAWVGARLGRPRAAAAAALAGVNVAAYLYAPLYCTYGAVRRLERELAAAVAEVRATARPQETLLLAPDAHFLGFRHATWYLPEYLTVRYPLKDGQKIFAAQSRQTRLLEGLPAAQEYPRRVLFPRLPYTAGYTRLRKADTPVDSGPARVALSP
jgi:4-amino-4-deoxy-L-arabinose transferase-like glycosyltransferase